VTLLRKKATYDWVGGRKSAMAIFRALNHFVVGGNEALVPFE
jgi:hypothetical protein